MSTTMLLRCLIVVLFITSSVNCTELDDLVDYVTNYINFTTYYELPTDNSEMYIDNADTAMPLDYGSFDFIIVGGGSAGTVLARRLTENEKFSVLLIEAGKTEDNFTDIPAMNAYTRNSPFNWGFMTVPQENSCLGMTDQKCVYPTGKGLGGSNIIGDMVYTRGNKAEFDNWAKLGNKGWSYKEVLPYFKKTERDETNDPRHTSQYHSVDGILPVNYTYPYTMNYYQYLEANKLCGLEEIDINGKSQIGIQSIPWSIKDNKRQTGGSAFIVPVLNRTNLNVTLEAFVTKLVIEEDTVTGVEFIKGKQLYRATATKEVILAAGAISSPQLLMLSGIGPKEELEKHNINVKVDLPVGKNLSDQPVYVGMYIRTNQTAPNLTVVDYLQLYLKGERPFTSIFNAQHIAYLNTKTRQNPPNIEIISINPPTTVPGDLKVFYNLNEVSRKSFAELNTLTDYLVYIIVTNPKSRGTVTLKSSSPVDFPYVDTRFYTDDNDEDLQTMYDGIKYVLNMTNTAPLQSINATVIARAPQCEHWQGVSEEKYWKCAIKQLSSTICRPIGTTRMGASSKDSVVDAKLKVHGIKNLRVCDTGAMPSPLSAHLYAAVMMMAEKLSDIIKKQYS